MEPYPESVKRALYDRALIMAREAIDSQDENNPKFDSENHAIEYFYERLTETFKEGWAAYQECFPSQNPDWEV